MKPIQIKEEAPFTTSKGHDTPKNNQLPKPNPMLHSMSGELPQEIINKLPLNVPTWRLHTYVVHIVDFKAIPRYRRDVYLNSGAKYETGDRNESGIFIRTHEKKWCGHLYAPRRHPVFDYYELESQHCKNLIEHDHFESESAIGFIFENDYKNYFDIILRQISLPEERNSHYGDHRINDQPLPPANSTD